MVTEKSEPEEKTDRLRKVGSDMIWRVVGRDGGRSSCGLFRT
jgi:hypothetical protein